MKIEFVVVQSIGVFIDKAGQLYRGRGLGVVVGEIYIENKNVIWREEERASERICLYIFEQ